MTLVTSVHEHMLRIESDLAITLANRPTSVGIYMAHADCDEDMCDLRVVKFGGPEFDEVPESELCDFIGKMPPPPKCMRGLGMSFQHAEVRYFAFALQGGHVITVQRVMQPHNNSKPRCFIVPPDRLLAGETAVIEAVMSLRNLLERGGHDVHGSQSSLQSAFQALGLFIAIIPGTGTEDES